MSGAGDGGASQRRSHHRQPQTTELRRRPLASALLIRRSSNELHRSMDMDDIVLLFLWGTHDRYQSINGSRVNGTATLTEPGEGSSQAREW